MSALPPWVCARKRPALFGADLFGGWALVSSGVTISFAVRLWEDHHHGVSVALWVVVFALNALGFGLFKFHARRHGADL